MANEFFTATGYPATRASGSSSAMRAQLAALEAAFDKLPTMAANGGRLVAVNAGATALETIASINGITIGATTPASGAFTTLSSSGLATLASAAITGALAANGAVTLGDAAGDALTINPSAVTWANNPTHSGNHTFSGNLTVNGNTALGNAAGDTLTVAPSAVTWSNNPTHSGNHTYSGVILLSAGSAGAPSLAIAGDADTGVFQNGANVLAFATAGTIGFQVNSTQGVHVGDSAVDAGSSSVGVYLRARLTSSATTQYGLFSNAMASANATGTVVGVHSAPRFADGAYSTTNAFNFRAADPSAGAGHTIQNTVGYYCDDLAAGANSNRGMRLVLSSGAGKHNVYADGTADNYFRGNVGIGSGKTAPAVALDVAGEFALTSSGSTAMLSLENTNAGSTGVIMESYANSASPANGDDVFVHTMYGEDSVGAQIPYATWQCSASNVGVGATQTTIRLQGRQGGSTVTLLQFANGAAYFPSIGTTASAANAFLNSGSSPANQLLRSTSSIRYKTDLLDLAGAEAEALIGRMRPITYRSKAEADDPKRRWYGFIAEELATIEPRLVHFIKDETGMDIPDGVQYERVTVLLVAAVQRMLKRLAIIHP